jgi:hypothetical protein
MRSTDQSPPRHYRLLRASLSILLPLFLSILACSLPGVGGGGASLQETDIALGIQQTFVAQTSTALQAATPVVPTLPPAAETPIQGQAPNAPTNPPPTDTPALPPTETVAATSQPSPAPAKISLTKWKKLYFLEISSGCKFPDMPCWKSNDGPDVGFDSIILTSAESTAIDPNWNNPYLVFWHKYYFDKAAEIDVSSGSSWEVLQVYGQGNRDWIMQSFNLSRYKGKSVSFRFVLEPYHKISTWLIQDIQIVPDFKPPP